MSLTAADTFADVHRYVACMLSFLQQMLVRQGRKSLELRADLLASLRPFFVTVSLNITKQNSHNPIVALAAD